MTSLPVQVTNQKPVVRLSNGNNITTTPLAGDATWEGDWERSDADGLTVSCLAVAVEFEIFLIAE